MRALIVEDDLTSRRMLLMMLAQHAQCDVALDGAEALEAFDAAWAEGEPYNLILLDIMMPRMDGQVLLKKIRAREAERGVEPDRAARVIMTTALDDRENIIEAFRSQCEAYLVKPIDKEALLEQVRSLGLLPPAR